MATSADLLVDTSAAVPLLVEDHELHIAALAAAAGRPLGLAGHAWFETFSVLTRLPVPHRVRPAVAAAALERGFPATVALGAPAARRLRAMLPEIGVAGGSVYDALVGAAAAEHGSPLLTADRRAWRVYLALGVEAVLVQA